MKLHVFAMERGDVPAGAESCELSLMGVGGEGSIGTQTVVATALGVQRKGTIGMNDDVAMRKRTAIDALHVGTCRVEMPDRILRSFLIQHIRIRGWSRGD